MIHAMRNLMCQGDALTLFMDYDRRHRAGRLTYAPWSQWRDAAMMRRFYDWEEGFRQLYAKEKRKAKDAVAR